jgi:hypothetical protein
MIKALSLALLAAGCIGTAPGDPPPAVDPAPPAPAPDPTPTPGTGSGSGSAAAPMTATQYLHQRGVKLCDEEFACKSSWPGDPATGLTFEQTYGATAADCYADTDAQDQPSAVAQEITQNHISYSAPNAATCIAGIAFPADCSTFWTSGPLYPASCGAAMRGLVADGDPCVTSYDCLNQDSYCDINALVCAQKP